MKEFLINENEAGQRFDKYLTKLMKEAPKSFFYKMLRKKNITLNGKKATGNEKLYEKMDLNGFESLYMNTALVDILNITGPHPGWSRPISGSKGLPY